MIRNKNVTIVIILLSVGLAIASVDTAWVRRYSGPGDSIDEAKKIAVDALGNVYITGSSYGSGTFYDYATIKYNSAGETLWVRRYNGPGDSTDIANALAIDVSGNVYVTGRSWGLGTDFDYATIKYNSAGESLWVRRYNGPGNDSDYANAIAVDDSGNVYVTGGSLGSAPNPDNDCATIKYSPSGETLWVRRFDGPISWHDEGSAIVVDNSGNVYITGMSYYAHGTLDDYVTIKYNSAGVQQWARNYDGPRNEYERADAIAVDDSGNVYVTGYSYGNYFDIATIKYDSAGNERWVSRYDRGFSDDGANAIAVDNSGNVYVTGESQAYGSYAGKDYVTIKYNSSGETLWTRIYNGSGNNWDIANAIALDGSGNIYVTGQTYSSTTNWDYATLDYNSAGVQQWVRRYNGPENGADYGNAIAVDDSENIYVTGASWNSGTSLDYVTIKYVQIPGIRENQILNLERLTSEIYPNPAKTFLAVRLPQTADHQTMKIFDVSGKLVKVEKKVTSAQEHKQEMKISLKGMNLGIYFLKLGKETKKFIVAR